ncbi:MAG: cysteine desulfurase-like protein [Chloroflexota bacterium]
MKHSPEALDIPALRRRFPALRRHPETLYFDNPAGTQVPDETIEGFVSYFNDANANEGGSFAASRATDSVIAGARDGMRAFLNAASPDEIIFGQNMSSLTFHLSHALRRVLRPGDEIVTTRLEHDANVSPWLALEDLGVVVKWIDLDPETGRLDLQAAESAFSNRTRLLAVGYASNALGTINDVKRLTALGHAHGALVFVDAVHFAPHGSIDVQAIGCDFLACSAYKFFGPHLGILYGRREALDRLPSPHVRPAGDEPPHSWETGTQSHEAFAGLLGTLRYLRSLSSQGEEVAPSSGREQLEAAFAAIRRYELTLSERLLAGLAAVPGVTVYGITRPEDLDRRVPTVSFRLRGYEPEELSVRLGEHAINSWAGNHYALEPLARLGLDATNRIGLVHYNTYDEIERFLGTLQELAA